MHLDLNTDNSLYIYSLASVVVTSYVVFIVACSRPRKPSVSLPFNIMFSLAAHIMSSLPKFQPLAQMDYSSPTLEHLDGSLMPNR